MTNSTALTPRRMTTRKWGKMTVAGAALGAAIAGPAAAGSIAPGPDLLWLAQATGTEGGEGGESGSAAVDVSDKVGILVSLAKLDAHLLTGMALMQAGSPEAAKAQIETATVEIYPTVEPSLRAQNAPLLDDALASLAKAEGVQGAERVAGASAAIVAARRAVAPSPKEVLAAVLALAREAADDFEKGIQNGTVVDMGEYQDARAYLIAARAMTVDLASADDAVVQGAAEKTLAALDSVIIEVPDVAPKGTVSADAALFLSAAARIELASYQVR
jgi:hypothetical protein